MKDNTYIGADGLKYCSIHNLPIEKKYSCLEKPIFCGCSECKEITQNKKVCFSDAKMMIDWTFENDDRQRYPDIRKALMKYCEQFNDSSKSLLLYGDYGTGKSFFAACVVNALIEKGYKVYSKDFVKFTNQLQERFEGRQENIDYLKKYDFIFLDEIS